MVEKRISETPETPTSETEKPPYLEQETETFLPPSTETPTGVAEKVESATMPSWKYPWINRFAYVKFLRVQQP
jgi:hypothetical protein